MNKKNLTFTLTITFLLFFGSPSIAVIDEYQDAVDAYNREDYKTSYQLMIPLADKGFAQAQYNLGVMYEKGNGVKQNHRKAKKWFSLAADQDHAKAVEKLNSLSKKKVINKSKDTPKGLVDNSFNLNAENFQDGLNPLNKDDYETAHQLLLQLAEQGIAKDQYNLGLMYAKGKGVVKDYSKAIKWWTLAAEQGNGKAQTNLGWVYEKGKGVPIDFEKATKWYQLASDQGIAKAQDKLNLFSKEKIDNKTQDSPKGLTDNSFYLNAKNFQDGLNAFNKEDFESAHQLFLQLAEQGVSKAQYNLGLMYAKGKGVVKDDSKAIQWWTLAAEQGDGKAQTNLGWVYEKGKGVPIDAQKAAKWYQLAADQGIAKAQEKLDLVLNKKKGDLQENTVSSNVNPAGPDTSSTFSQGDAFDGARYSEETSTGDGDYINDSDHFHTALNAFNKNEFDIAYQLFFELADKGIAEAQINLGMMFENGQGVLQDFKEAVRWYRLAADQGLTKAQEKLNFLLKNKPRENPQSSFMESENNPANITSDDTRNDLSASESFHTALNAFNKNEFDIAYQLFFELADKGIAEAQINLGMMYENGQGVSQDFKEAVRWYRLAADQELTKAQYNLGLMYAQGKGVDKDPIQASKWYRLAADQGLIQAQTTLASMYHEGDGVLKNYEAASKLYRLAAEQGDADAQYKLGLMYSNGEGISQDNKEATKWFQLAVKQGNTLAQEKLDEILNQKSLWKKIKDIF